jgi:hypothetical protein
MMPSARSSSAGGPLDGGCAVELAQIPITAWIRPSAMALTKLS